MKKISYETFARAFDSPLAQVKSSEYASSLFYDYTLLLQVNGLFFISESREIYEEQGTVIESNCYRFDSEAESLDYADKKEYFFC